ncbi:MAG TPA: tetratricopeptide repeat protein [Pyrinomonadaceae bacterium]|jgi:tetratricopeptide (TPR) repeat protein
MKPLTLTLRVFVSSTSKDLPAERAALLRALRGLRAYRSVKINVVVMEEFVSRHEGARRTSTDEVGNSHFYVGVIGERYSTGITEAEYDKAHELGMRCLIYFKKNAPVERAGRARLSAFKKKLRDRHVCSDFAQPDELAQAVLASLRKYLDEFIDELSRPDGEPYAMPPSRTDFVGRRQEIRTLAGALGPSARDRVAVVHGMSGVGKTALALEVARRLRGVYTDARLFIKLSRTNDAPFGLRVPLLNCISQLGGRYDDSDNVESLAATFRQCLSGKRALIILDDAVDEKQIEHFLPPAGCALLVTSHEKLLAPDTGTEPLELRPFDEEDAHALLLRIEPRILPRAAQQIARLCGHLPLALRAAASLLKATPDLDPGEYVRRLRRERGVLEALGEKGVAVGVRASFNLSYERLPDGARRCLRRLSVFPASFDEGAALAVCEGASREELSLLVRRSLVSFDRKSRRYRLHDLMRAYAGRTPDIEGRAAQAAAERAAAAQRHSEYFRLLAIKIGEMYGGPPADVRKGVAKFDAEWENLCAGRAWLARRRASAESQKRCVEYAKTLYLPLLLRRGPKEQAAWLEDAQAACARLKWETEQGRFLCGLSTVYSSMAAWESAEDCCRRALELADKTRVRVAKADAHGSYGNAYVSAGLPSKAVNKFKQCLKILYEEEDREGFVRTLINLGSAYAALGRSHEAAACYKGAAAAAADSLTMSVALVNLGDECVKLLEAGRARECYEEALKLAKKTGDLRGKAAALNGLGSVCAATEQHRPALRHHRQALDISRKIGDKAGELAALCNQGNALAELKKTDEAVKAHEEALKICRRLGVRAYEVLVLGNLGHAYYVSGDYDRSITHHRQALALTRGLPNPTYRATALWNLAQARRRKGESVTPERHARAALKIYTRLGHPLAAAVREFLHQTGSDKGSSTAPLRTHTT